MLLVSKGCYDLTGYLPESFINNRDMAFNDIITLQFRDQLWKEWQNTIPNKLPYKCEYEITTATGEKKWALELGQGVYSLNGEVVFLEGIILDITDRKRIENNLRYLSEHDKLTGLYNREYLEFLLENDSKVQNGSKRAVLSINLSTVQLLTANYGFRYTQNLIKKAAHMLSRFCTDKRMLFKTYENRLLFYVKDYADKNELITFSDKIADALEQLFSTDRISGGIGILEIDHENDVNTDLLLKRLLIASESAINIFEKDFRACFYDKELEARVNREAEIRQALYRNAVDNEYGELFVEYQPIVDLDSRMVSGFEALARLKTDNLGFVSPLEFIPIAEKTKLIIQIGESIIIKAFRFLRRLMEHGYDQVRISINISAIQLLKPGFPEILFELLNKMELDPAKVGIEITESVFAIDYEKINNIIAKLREAGLNVAIDDFGTGYSSFAREKELNVDCLKIDKYFIDKLLVDNPEKSITSDIISMAHKLGHCAIAEGVEHVSQLENLVEHKCDKIQGYLISKPLDENAALEFLRIHENTTITSI